LQIEKTVKISPARICTSNLPGTWNERYT